MDRRHFLKALGGLGAVAGAAAVLPHLPVPEEQQEAAAEAALDWEEWPLGVYSFKNDANTGLYREGNGDLMLTTSGFFAYDKDDWQPNRGGA